MSKEQILKKAIEKAVNNGWKPYQNAECMFWDCKINGATNMLFDHEWAKAFWGEETYIDCPVCKGGKDKTRDFLDECDHCHGSQDKYRKVKKDMGWQYHITRLALSEDRLEYIKDYL